jgi:hypothetical protein
MIKETIAVNARVDNLEWKAFHVARMAPNTVLSGPVEGAAERVTWYAI